MVATQISSPDRKLRADIRESRISIVLTKFSSPLRSPPKQPAQRDQRFGETGFRHERRRHLQERPNERSDDRDSNNVAAQSFLAAEPPLSEIQKTAELPEQPKAKTRLAVIAAHVISSNRESRIDKLSHVYPPVLRWTATAYIVGCPAAPFSFLLSLLPSPY